MKFKRFDRLNIPHKWKDYFSEYPNGLTLIEAMIQWVSQVNDMVDLQNNLTTTVEDYRDELDDFISKFSGELQETVTDILDDWQQSGFLDVVISEALQWELDNFKTETTQNFEEVTTQLEQLTKNVKTFGAKGDGVTDDTLAIQTALDSLSKGQTLFFPDGIYNTKTVINRKNNTTLKFAGELNYIGTASFSALIIEGVYMRLETPTVRRPYNQSGTAKYELVGIGLDILNAKNIVIETPTVSGFGVGIAIHDTKGTGSSYIQTYNPFLINNLEAYKCIHDHATSWTTETKVYGGRIELSVQNYTDVTGSSYFNLLDDSHRFFGVSAEGRPERKVKGTFSESTFSSCRFEFPNGDVDIELNGNGNAFIHNRDFDNIYQNNGKNNVIISRFKSYFGHPIQQSIRHYATDATNTGFTLNSDFAYYLIDCTKGSAYLRNNFEQNHTTVNGSVFTVKKTDSSSNPVTFEIMNVDGTHINPRLISQNETITFMYLDGKWLVLSNDEYTYNLGFNHVTYGKGEKRKFYTNETEYLKYSHEICVEEGTTGSFDNLTGTGTQGSVSLVLSGNYERMTSKSWITVANEPYYVLNWAPETQTATLMQPLLTAVVDAVVNRKNPKMVKQGRILFQESNPPTTQQWRKGDIVYNSNPVAGGYVGWVCITGGVPGTWKEFGKIEV